MSRKNLKTEKIDKAIGKKIHELRIAKGWSRTQLGVLIDVTHQQVKKYEDGANRISAGRIMAVAIAFGVPIELLFELCENLKMESRDRASIELVRSFNSISNCNVQNSLMILARDISKLN